MKNIICALSLSREFNLATFIVGILSLCGVVVNIIVTAKNNKNKRYTDLITHNRISTMENLKNVSSNIFKTIYSIMVEGCDYNKNLQTFIECKTQVFYCINFKGKPEVEMRETLTALEKLMLNFAKHHKKLNDNQKNKIFETMEVAVNYYQTISCVYCKCEWQRAKATSLSVKEVYSTDDAYERYVQPLKEELNKQKEIILNNTFENIIKK